MTFDVGSRAKLGPRALPFYQGDTLFDRIARVVCRANCLPRKELYESWEVARRVRRRFRAGRVVDLACGHGLIAQMMLLLDDSSPSALAVDRRLPASSAALKAAFEAEWPRLVGRVELVVSDIREVAVSSADLVVSAHACGLLTDEVLAVAVRGRARVAVLPCCHDQAKCDDGGLGGWLDPAMAIDATRAGVLRAHGYSVRTQLIPAEITEKNRLLMGEPSALPHAET